MEERPATTRREIITRLTAGAMAAALPLRAQSSAAEATSVYRIHPAIGVARVGNADPSTFFIGPESVGHGPSGEAPGTAVPPYKVDGKVKPQASRFRLYEYRNIGGRLTPVQEITLSTENVVSITWKVHLANKKASFYRFVGPAGERYAPASLRNAPVSNRQMLEIDFGPRTISGASQGPAEFRAVSPYPVSCPLNGQGQPVIDYLGQLRTDSSGRLLVLGGAGKASYQPATAPTLVSYANNDGWFDDISDGPVTAIVKIRKPDNSTVDIAVDGANGAWVLSAPPDFAPRVRAVVTLYDLLYDVAVKSIPIPANNALYDLGQPLAKLKALKNDYAPGNDYELPGYVPNFTEDIFPILRSAYDLWWVTETVNHKHNSLLDPALADPGPGSQKKRLDAFNYLRPPVGIVSQNGQQQMPRLLGDNPYDSKEPEAVRRMPLTNIQYAMFRRWKDGAFVPPAPGSGVPPTEPVPPIVITPHGLDRAALENCSGGAFYPGIEVGWQIRNPALYAEPFRLNVNGNSGYWGETGQPMRPGHFSRQMALPWQADFNECANEGNYAWWPSQRPDDALPYYNAPQRLDWVRPDTKYDNGANSSTKENMVANWWKFGFVLQQGDQLVEKERTSPIP